MIYTRLHGRLGNQLFQYAAARALAARRGTKVVIDDRTSLRKGEGTLSRVFNLNQTAHAPLPPAKHDAPLRYAAWRALRQAPRLFREKSLGFDPAFQTLSDDTYLHGYWQSERYFTPIAEALRSELTFHTAMSPQNAEMAARIGETCSVSLHVRRGDYVGNGAMVLCDQAYYDQAVAAVRAQLDRDPTVFVFSDDPAWAKENLPLPFEKIVVDFNGPEADYEDLRLMGLCQHNILANSSFSWWGAWLGETPGAIVTGPARWFADPKLSNPDILADRWLRISV